MEVEGEEETAPMAWQQDRLLAILEQTSDLIVTADLDGRITYMNRACRLRLGIAFDAEVEGLTLRDGHPPEAAGRLVSDAVPLAIERGIWRGESLCIDRMGIEFPVSLIVIAHRDETGTVQYFSSIARDISAEKEAARRSTEEAKAMRFVVEAATDAIWTWDLQQDRIYWSPEVCALLDLDPAAFPIPLAVMMEQVHPEDEEGCRRAMVAHLEEGAPFDFEVRLRHGKGGYRTMACHGKALRDGGGRPVRMAGSMRDVTDQKAADAHLRQSERKYRQLIEMTGTGYLILDEDGAVLDANSRFLEMSGRTAISDVLGRNAFDWLLPRNLGTDSGQVLSDGFVRNLEVDCHRPDGSTIALVLNASMTRENGARRMIALCREAR